MLCAVWLEHCGPSCPTTSLTGRSGTTTPVPSVSGLSWVRSWVDELSIKRDCCKSETSGIRRDGRLLASHSEIRILGSHGRMGGPFSRPRNHRERLVARHHDAGVHCRRYTTRHASNVEEG